MYQIQKDNIIICESNSKMDLIRDLKNRSCYTVELELKGKKSVYVNILKNNKPYLTLKHSYNCMEFTVEEIWWDCANYVCKDLGFRLLKVL